MLARRFTIICLLTTLFGMLFAILVAEAGRSTRWQDMDASNYCVFAQGQDCAAARN
jgi:hypothetical protein